MLILAGWALGPASGAGYAQEPVLDPEQVDTDPLGPPSADPEEIDMLLFEGELYLEQGQYRDAVLAFSQVVELAPDRLVGHLNLARALTAALVSNQLNNTRAASIEALRQYRWVLAKAPNHPEALKGVELLSEQFFGGMSVPLTSTKGRKSWAAGEYSMREGDFPAAIDAFSQAAEAEPTVADVHRALGDAYLGNSNYDEAETAYRRALEIDPEDANSLEGLGLVHEGRGEPGEALPYYLQAYGLDPDSAPATEGLLRLLEDAEVDDLTTEVRLALGRAQVSAEQFESAIETLGPVLADMDPRDPEAIKALGVARYFTGDLPGAAERFTEARELDPNDLEATYYLAATRLQQGDLEEGMMLLRIMLESDPDNPNALRLLGLTLAETPGEEEAAVEFLGRARAVGAPVENISCILGTLNMRLERFDAAYREFVHCQDEKPDYPGSYLALGMIADDRGHRGEAIVQLEAYRNTVEEAEPGAIFRLGVAYLRVGRDEDAYDILHELVAEDDTTEVTEVQLLEMTSFFLATVRRLDDSIFIGEMLLTKDTDNPVYNNNLAMAYADADEQPERALSLAEKANRFDPDNPGHMDTLGWALIRMGRFSEAEEVLLKSIEIASGDGRSDLSEIYYHLGVLYRETDRRDEAQEYLVRALENPTTPFLQDEIQGLLDRIEREAASP